MEIIKKSLKIKLRIANFKRFAEELAVIFQQ